MFPVECVARGYLSGSGWKDYQATGAICGIPLPAGLRESDKLPEPIFTPAAKINTGGHDENISFDTVVDTVGAEHADALRDLTLAIYAKASAHAGQQGRHPRRHQVRVRPDLMRRQAHHPRRRSPHARLQPLLARRQLRARRPAPPASTSSTSATTSSRSTGTSRPPRRPCPMTSSPEPAPNTCRPSPCSPAATSL